MDIIKKYCEYLIIILSYYILPSLFVIDTGSGMFFLLLVIPASVFIVSAVFAVRNGFKWYFSVIAGFLWFPNILIMNSSAAVYIAIYGAISFVGQFIGFLINGFLTYKKDKK